MNTVVTSREAILKKSRELIQTQGWEAVNIRSVAKACDISIGSIYNYFQNKTALVAATVESVWCDIFHMSDSETEFLGFTECIEWTFESMKKGNEKYPDFFTMHSMSFMGESKKDGQQLMEKSWQHMKSGFYQVLMRDKKVKEHIFDECFTPEKFVNMVFSLIVASMIRHDYDSSGIIRMAELILYR